MAEETANSSENTAHGAPQLDPYKWKPGESGNPSGRPKKKPITELYERILSNPDNLAHIEQATLRALKKGQMAMVLQLREMAERVEGKVTQPVEVTGQIELSERMAKARERTATDRS
jgi:hypothetical protein